MQLDRKDEIRRASHAHLNAIFDHMTVYDPEDSLTEDIQYHVTKVRELMDELLGDNEFEPE